MRNNAEQPVRPPITISEKLSSKLANMAFICTVFVVAMHTPGPRRIFGLDLIGGGLALIAVPFFFAASGFFIAGHMDNAYFHGKYLAEIKKRVKSLIVPYLIWNIAWILFMFSWTIAVNWHCGRDLFLNCDNILINGVTMQHHAAPRMIECIPRDVASGIGIDPFRLPFVQQLWYVRALFLLIIISPVLRRFATIKGLLVLWIAYLILRPWGGASDAGGYLLAEIFHSVKANSFFRIFLSAEGMFYFTCGIFLRFSPVVLSKRSFAICCLTGVAFLSLYAYCDMDGRFLGGKYFRFFALPFLLVSVWRVVPNCRWPKWLITSAFPVFLCHRCSLFFLDNIVHIPKAWLPKVVMVTSISIVASLILRKSAPNLAKLFFGGR